MPLSSATVRRRGRFDLVVVSTFVATPHDHLDELPVSADRMDAYAAAGPDPWHAFTGYIHTICAIQAADRGFTDALTMTFPAAPAHNDFVEPIDRAKAGGHLRHDLTDRDVMILLMADTGVVGATADAAPDA